MRPVLLRILRGLKQYFLIGSNTALNIFTPLAILDHVAAHLSIDEAENRELTRLVIVGLYAALVLGMEYRSARRTTEEVMAEPNGGEPGDGWHNSAIGFDCWYKTIGKGVATAMVISKLGGGAIAGTLTGLVLGAGGYLHARNPGLRPNDIIHQPYHPGQWGMLMSVLLWAGVVASAIDNSGRYITTYKIAAHEIVDAFHDSDTEPYLDDDVLFLAAAFLSSTATMYSKFLLARNRSADIWNMHAAARSWQDWFGAIDKWALLGAGAHAVLAYCNDRFLTQRPVWGGDKMPDWLSLTGSMLLPSLGFLGTYATNADYSRWGIEDGILVRRGPAVAPEESREFSAEEKKQASASTPLLGSHPPSSSSSPSLRKLAPVSPQLSVSPIARGRRRSSVLVYEVDEAVIRRDDVPPVVGATDLEIARDVLFSNGEFPDNGHPESSSLAAGRPNANTCSEITVPLLTAQSLSSSVLNPEAKGSPRVQEEFAAGQPNANPPRPSSLTQTTVPPPPAPAEASTSVAQQIGWGIMSIASKVGRVISFLGRNDQLPSTNSRSSSTDESAYGAVPTTEDPEQNPNQNSDQNYTP
jgi:hypothetical protein